MQVMARPAIVIVIVTRIQDYRALIDITPLRSITLFFIQHFAFVCPHYYIIPRHPHNKKGILSFPPPDAGHLLPAGILPGVSNIEFTADPRWMMYISPNKAGRPSKVWCRSIDT